MARGLGGDPKTAAGGTGVYGSDLSKDGAYAASATTFAESPDIDLAGKTGVRLQYQRWLAVEDGFYDDARVLVNGTEAWRNLASTTEPQQDGIHHIDREWRFSDIELAAHEAAGKVKLRFELTSDEGLQFGGWTLDDVCIVVPAMGPGPATCGNGVVDDAETCDDGNVSDGDGCSAACEDENGGGGGGGDEDPADSGCCSVGGGPEGALALSLLTLGLVLRKRSRRRAL
jgi:cysteine-rich repeat protein